LAQRHRVDAQRYQCLDQAEPRGDVVADHPTRYHAVVVCDHLNLFGFEDQITDRQNQTVLVDHDARALPVLAEGPDRSRLVDGKRANANDGRACTAEQSRLEGKVVEVGVGV
jgi:hypothetical protein